MVIEVKAGANVTIADLRTLHSVLEREQARMAGLLVMELLAERKMRNFARPMAEVGDLDVTGTLPPRMRMLSIPQLLAGERFSIPGE